VIPVDSFRTRIKGPVIEPFDPDYSAVLVGGIDGLVSVMCSRQMPLTWAQPSVWLEKTASRWRCAAEPQGDGFRVMNGGLVVVLRDSPEIASDTKAANKGGSEQWH